MTNPMICLSNIPTESTFQSWLWNQGPTVVFLALAVYIVGKGLIAESAKKDAAKQELINELRTRVSVLEQQRTIDGQRLDTCEEERATLRAEINVLKRKVDA